MQMPGRKFAADNSIYKYGFGGKENDNEVKGNTNQIAYENRIYDPRIARWLSVDPLQKKYPDLTPYNFSGNSPIVFGDYDGKDFGLIYDLKNKKVYVVGTYYVSKQEELQVKRALNNWNSKSAVAIDGYTVVFSLKTKVPEIQTKEEFLKSNVIAAKSKKRQQTKIYNQYVDNVLWSAKERDPIGNAYYGSDFVNSSVQSTASGSFIGGATAANYIYMNKGDEGSDFANQQDLVSHEVGHTLGLQDPPKNSLPADQKPFHPIGGIMEYTKTGKQLPINDKDITTVYEYAKGYIGNLIFATLFSGISLNKNFENRAKVGAINTMENIRRAVAGAIMGVNLSKK